MNIILPEGPSILYPGSPDQPRVLELTDNFSPKITDVIVTAVSTNMDITQIVVLATLKLHTFFFFFFPPRREEYEEGLGYFQH